MTYTEICEMAEETNLPVAYDHFAEGESPDPPFLVFCLPGSDNFSADGVVFGEITEVRFELYTDRKSPDVEAVVETILNNHEIYWEKYEIWIPEEQMYEVAYEMEVTYA